MNNPDVQGESWFQATVRWAVMVEGRGLREWEEAVYLFRSEDYESAYQRAWAIGEGGQSGGEEGIQCPRWVETRLAEVVTLDCLGSELEDDWRCTGCGGRPKRRSLSNTSLSRPTSYHCRRFDRAATAAKFLNGPSLRFALTAAP